jgi:hypothetical protein
MPGLQNRFGERGRDLHLLNAVLTGPRHQATDGDVVFTIYMRTGRLALWSRRDVVDGDVSSLTAAKQNEQIGNKKRPKECQGRD